MIDPCCSTADPSTVTDPQWPVGGGLSRRHLILGGALAGTALAFSAVPSIAQSTEGTEAGRDFGFDPPRPADERHVRPIVFPVEDPGAVDWTDTYLAPRGGGRRHEGQDLIGPKMTRLVAAVTGTIVELRHRSSGNSLYLKGDDGWYYCYLHINNDTPGTDNGSNAFGNAFAPGMANGVRVRRGQHIAYMGDSGNAEGTVSHLHFEIRMPNARWYNAAAVNPKYSLDAAPAAGPQVPPETFSPWDNAVAFVDRQYRDLIGRPPPSASLTGWTDLLNSGAKQPHELIVALTSSPVSDSLNQCVVRLYQAFFLRLPDQGGFTHWVAHRRYGVPLAGIADKFAESAEFRQRYGARSNAEYVDLVYRNVLLRAADPGGRAHWLGQLDAGRLSRGGLMLRFSDSAEFKAAQHHRADVFTLWGAMMRRNPGTARIDGDAALVANGSRTLNQLADAIRRSGEYASVVART